MKAVNKSNAEGLATRLLEMFGNTHPTKKQIKLVETLLIKKNLNHEIVFHKKLTNREVSCLFLAACGMTIEGTAEILQVKTTTVKTWRTNVIHKLDCASMAEAAFKGIGYGYIPANLIDHTSKHPTFVGKIF